MENKPKTEYYIYKMYVDGPEVWDGPFQTLERAKEEYATIYLSARNGEIIDIEGQHNE